MTKGFVHIPTFKAATVVRLALALLAALCVIPKAYAGGASLPMQEAFSYARADECAAQAPEAQACAQAGAPEAVSADSSAVDAGTVAGQAAAGAVIGIVADATEATATESTTAAATEAAATEATAPSPDDTAAQQWRLPQDREAGKPYNKHFKPGEVLKGDPALVHPEFLLDQNLFGAQRLTTHGNFRFTEEFTIYYRRNKTDIDTSYLWNPAQITQLRSFLRKDIVVDTITVYAYASPEGHYGHNVWLSRQRAENARKYIVEEYGLDPGKVRICQQEENWPGLRQAMQTPSPIRQATRLLPPRIRGEVIRFRTASTGTGTEV